MVLTLPSNAVSGGSAVQVGVSEILSLLLPLASQREPQYVSGAGNTEIYALGLTFSSAITLSSSISLNGTTLNLNGTLAATLAAAPNGTFFVALQSATTYVDVGTMTYSYNANTGTLTIASGVTPLSGSSGITQSGIYVLYLQPQSISVTSGNMEGWSFINDCGVETPNTTPGFSASLVTGPATPPLGPGSAQLSVAATNECVMVATAAYAGIPLSDLTTLQYYSYQAGPKLAIYLAFDVRYHPSDTGYQGRLIFEPYQNGAVSVGSGWQSWNALNGKWWASNTNSKSLTSSGGSNGLCTQSNACTWSQILTDWPNASILPSGNVLLKAGSGWSSFTGYVDDIIIGIGGSKTTFDFWQ